MKKEKIAKLLGVIAVTGCLVVPFAAYASQTQAAAAKTTSQAQTNKNTADAALPDQTVAAGGGSKSSVTENAEAEERGDSKETDDAAGQAALKALAKLDEAQAEVIAQTAAGVNGVTYEGLGDENGTPAYEFKYTDDAGKKQEIEVNAVTGEIVQDNETEDENETGTDDGGNEVNDRAGQ